MYPNSRTTGVSFSRSGYENNFSGEATFREWGYLHAQNCS